RLLLIDTSESTIFHGLEMSRKPWAYHAFLLWVLTSQPKKWLASSSRRLENLGSLEIKKI
ncbi:hypothetical protein, partial [Xanthomonas campestris]|uniref:hypothetical protein n=1 Tax=Xanthomonas campestris TaxID=339 RepID=UPI0025A302A4